MKESTTDFELRAWREQFILNWGKQHRCLQPAPTVDSAHIKTTYCNNQRLSCRQSGKYGIQQETWHWSFHCSEAASWRLLIVRDIIDNLTLPLGPKIFIFHMCHSLFLTISFSSAHCSAAMPACLFSVHFY